jgi:four helix bundle protein
MAFRFERLLVWPKALAFADEVVSVSLKWPALMQSSYGDQTRRAAVSIITNITEASGKRTGGSRRLFYDHARGSTYEMMGIMALAQKRGLINEAIYNAFYQSADEVAAMLWGLMEAETATEERGEKGEERQGYRKFREEQAGYDFDNEDNDAWTNAEGVER